MNTFKGRDFLKLLDFTPAEIGALLDLSADLKAKKKNGVVHRLCEGKNLALIFEKTSTRTRCAFEVAARDLGMGVTYLDPTGSQIGKKESIADTARVLSGMFDGIEYRGFGQSIVEELAKAVHCVDVPVARFRLELIRRFVRIHIFLVEWHIVIEISLVGEEGCYLIKRQITALNSTLAIPVPAIKPMIHFFISEIISEKASIRLSVSVFSREKNCSRVFPSCERISLFSLRRSCTFGTILFAELLTSRLRLPDHSLMLSHIRSHSFCVRTLDSKSANFSNSSG